MLHWHYRGNTPRARGASSSSSPSDDSGEDHHRVRGEPTTYYTAGRYYGLPPRARRALRSRRISATVNAMISA